jgi:hypothetical protein
MTALSDGAPISRSQRKRLLPQSRAVSSWGSSQRRMRASSLQRRRRRLAWLALVPLNRATTGPAATMRGLAAPRPIYGGQPGYRDGMNGDGDGIACKPYRGW